MKKVSSKSSSSESFEFCPVPVHPNHRFSSFERLTYSGGEKLQRVINIAANRNVAADYPWKNEDIDIWALQEAALLYGSGELKKNPRSFFSSPLAPYEVKEHLLHGLPDGEVVDISFKSSYTNFCKSAIEPSARRLANEVFYARMWRHKKRSTATIVALHGWGMGDQRVNSLVFLPGIFYRLGLDVVLVELPYHGRRQAPEDFQKNGLLFPGPDMFRTNEAMGQTIFDLRQLIAYLQNQGNVNIGCIGMSFGAYSGSLLASLDPLAFFIPIVPVACLAETAWEIVTRSPGFLELKNRGLSLDLFKTIFHVHSPLSYVPQTPRENVLVISGIGDSVVPARQAKLLWDHWRGPETYRMYGGHTEHLKRARAMRRAIKFLKNRGFTSTLLSR